MGSNSAWRGPAFKSPEFSTHIDRITRITRTPFKQIMAIRSEDKLTECDESRRDDKSDEAQEHCTLRCRGKEIRHGSYNTPRNLDQCTSTGKMPRNGLHSQYMK